MNKTSRILYVDILKTLAVILIIMQHIIASACNDLPAIYS